MASKLTQVEFEERLAVSNPNIVALEPFVNTSTPLLVKCKVCDCEWSITPRSLLRGVGCPFCAHKRPIPGKTDFASQRPDLLEEWDYEKNSKQPNQYLVGSNKNVYWICKYGHRWKATINNRVYGNTGCPICSGRAVIKGISDFQSQMPELMKEWDLEKNTEICMPNSISPGSHLRVWWKCQKGHSWRTEVRERVKGSSCPYCSGKKVLPGFNDLKTKNPNLIKEWNFKKNTVLPDHVGIGSNVKVWWKCLKCGNEWQASIANRTSGSACPKCSRELVNQKLKTAEYKEGLSYLYPELIDEWDYEKNKNINPDVTYPGSTQKAWWKCPTCGSSYCASIGNRVNGSACPVCAGKKIVPGHNDLQAWCQKNDRLDLLEEWDYEKNDIRPEDMAPFSGRKCWFICKEGHSYKSIISNKTGANVACPICGKARRTSFPEQAVYFYIKKAFTDAINSYQAAWLGKFELDIYIPSISVGIEYDGITWHADQDKDLRKNQLCIDNGVKLIRIREKGLEQIEECINLFVESNNTSSLEQAINKVFELLQERKIDINLERDTAEIIGLFDTRKKENSIANRFPELIKEWNYEKNHMIDPEYVNYGSTRKIWWKCSTCGHEWLMSPNARTNQKQGCPKCLPEKKSKAIIASKLKESGSLEDSELPVLAEWDCDKNTILPSDVTKGSKQKVWWKCSVCGGSWLAQVYNRTKNNGTGCPYCSGRNVLKGFNDLQSTFPEQSEEWHLQKNFDLYPDMFTAGSSKKVWWLCPKCGISYCSSIKSRVNGTGCPVCNKKKQNANHRKKVKCIETGQVFSSVSEAAKWAGVSASTLVGHLKKNAKSSGGYHWEYFEDYK